MSLKIAFHSSDEINIYFIIYSKKIESTNELGVRLPSITSFLFGNHKMYGLTAVGGECSLFFSPCTINNGDCSDGQICLVNLNVPTGRVCL